MMEEPFFVNISCEQFSESAEQALAKWRMTAAHLPFSRAGSAIRYALSDLQAYMERQKVPATE